MAFGDFVQSKTSNGGASGVTTLNVVLDATPTVGNFLVLAAAQFDNASGNVSVSSTGVSWTIVPGLAFGASATGLVLAIGHVRAGASATITVTQTSSGGMALAVYEFVGASPRFDLAASATATSTSPASGSTGTTNTATELLIGAIAHRITNGTTISSATLNGGAATGLIQDKTSIASTADRTVGLFYLRVSSTGTPAAAATLANSGVWVCSIATIDEITSGGGGGGSGVSRARIVNG